MRAVVQRVTESTVTVADETVAQIGAGLLILLAVAREDSEADAEYLAGKIANLRIFEDSGGKLNRSLLETGGEMLIVSQFTLLGDCRKGRRPSFVAAAEPLKATELYEFFIEKIREFNIPVQTGQFRAMMDVALINSGPVTLILDT